MFCVCILQIFFFRMANHVPLDGRYGGAPDRELYGNDSIGLPSPWTGRVVHGAGKGKGSSFFFPASDRSPMLHVPSVGPGVRYTAGSVPRVQAGSHTDSSVSNTHVYVGRVTVAGGSSIDGWVLNPFRRCPAHSTSWQAGCAVCDRALSFPSTLTTEAPAPLAASACSFGRGSTEPTRPVGLDLVEHEVAQHVGHHESRPLAPISVDQLMQANRMVSPAQEWKSARDLPMEAFLRRFEKKRIRQQQLVYRLKLKELVVGIRRAMTPLFSLTSELDGFVAKLKLFCGELGIPLAQLDRNMGFRKGADLCPRPVTRWMGASHGVSVPLVNPGNMLGGLGLPSGMTSRVRKRINQVHRATSGTVETELGRLQDLFRYVYDLSSTLAFATCEDLDLFFRLSGFHDEALGSLLRHRLILLSEPASDRGVVGSARQSGVDLEVGDEVDLPGSVQSGGLSVPFPPTNAKPKSGKQREKRALPQTGFSVSSYHEDGEAMNAGRVSVIKVCRKPKKARVEDIEADNAAKTDGASAAPQDSGELFWLFLFALLHESLQECL